MKHPGPRPRARAVSGNSGIHEHTPIRRINTQEKTRTQPPKNRRKSLQNVHVIFSLSVTVIFSLSVDYRKSEQAQRETQLRESRETALGHSGIFSRPQSVPKISHFSGENPADCVRDFFPECCDATMWPWKLSKSLNSLKGSSSRSDKRGRGGRLWRIGPETSLARNSGCCKKQK